MNLVFKCCVLFSAILAGVSAQAVEPMALYDDFNAKSIDADKWLGQQSGQSGQLLDVAREIHGNRLRLAARTLGNMSSSGGVSGRLRLAFPNPDAVTAIEATLEVRKVEATSCPSTFTRAAVRLSGFFFNTGTSTPALGNGTNDVLASVQIERFANSTDPEGVLQVQGSLIRCTNPDCSSGPFLGPVVSLGSMEVGGRARIRIQWDPDYERFIFQRDDQLEVFASYVGLASNAFAPGIRAKRIDLAHDVANCLSARSTGLMDLHVNNVFVNASAAPAP